MDKKMAGLKDENEGVARICFILPIPLKNSFKARLAQRGQNMSDILVEFVREYVQNDKNK